MILLRQEDAIIVLFVLYRTTTCPMLLDEAKREIKTPLTNNNAKKLFEMLIGLEAKQSDIKSKLQEWCSINASTISVPVDVDNTELQNKCSDILCIGFKESTSVEYPLDKVKSLMESYKINPFLYLLTDRDKLDRIVKTKKAARELFRKDVDMQETFKQELLEIQNKTVKVSFRRYKENLNKPK